MKKLALLFVLALLIFSLPVKAERSNGIGTNEQFKGPVGMCMYSLRDIAKAKGLDAAMQFAEDQGFTIVEASDFFGHTAQEYKSLLDKHHLYASSLPTGYDQLKTKESLDKVISDAKTLGAKYVRIAWIPHDRQVGFTMENAREAVKVFNEAGKYLAENGLSYCYHNHGFEFVPYDGCAEGETLFDVLVRETNPEWVNFEMDVVWVANPGYDPVTYMKRYPTRWRLMHVKDFSGKDAMVFGESGRIDFPALLKTAQEVGFKYYFIEHDDTRKLDEVTPKNIQFLENVKF